MYRWVEGPLMTGQLITFPIRLYVRGARLLLHVAEDVTAKAMMSTLRVAGALGNLRPGASDGAAPAQAAPASDGGRSSEATRRSGPARGAGSRTASPRRRSSGASRPNGDRATADRPAS